MWCKIIAALVFTTMLTGCYGPVSGSMVGGDIAVEMWASTSCAQPGDTIHLRATATNRGNRVWIVDTKDEPVFDILFPIRWSAGKPLTADLTHLELQPGQSKSIEMDYVLPKGISGVVGAQAQFIYSPTAPGGTARPGVTINVGSCPGPLGP